MPKLPRVNARRVSRALERAGFVRARTQGSHMVYIHHDNGRSTVVPNKKGRDVPVGTLHDILKQAGLSVESFIELLR